MRIGFIVIILGVIFFLSLVIKAIRELSAARPDTPPLIPKVNNPPSLIPEKVSPYTQRRHTEKQHSSTQSAGGISTPPVPPQNADIVIDTFNDIRDEDIIMSQKRFCPYCGVPVKEDFAFCPYCGKEF